jgi:membrane protease YdiL (CAAX protease family)
MPDKHDGATDSRGKGYPSPIRNPAVQAVAASAGMVLFALAAHASLPGFLMAVAGLICSALAIATSFRSEDPLASLFGITPVSRQMIWWSFFGISGGVALAILFRHSVDRSLLLAGLQPFVVTAAAIGAAEELLFRGFVQGRLARLGGLAAVLMAAAAHTAYKTALFAFPPETLVIQYGPLAFWTFMVGAVFGLTRHLSGSVIPALTAHVLFDVLVYGDWARAPWWVWG